MTQEASPQTGDGYVKIANELFEAILIGMPCKIPAPVLIFFAVMRQTYGYNRTTAAITTKMFRKLTGIRDRRTIFRAKQQAIERKLINVIRTDDGATPKYKINKNYYNWQYVIRTDDSKRHPHRRRPSSAEMTRVIRTDDALYNKDIFKDIIKTDGNGTGKKSRDRPAKPGGELDILFDGFKILTEGGEPEFDDWIKKFKVPESDAEAIRNKFYGRQDARKEKGL